MSIIAPFIYRDHLDYQEKQGNKEVMVFQEKKDQQDQTVSQVLQEPQELQVHLDLKDQMDKRDNM